MSPAALDLVGLRKAYGGLVVTDDVSFSLPVGARHALIGPNGAGKSTLVGLVSGVVRADAGRIALNGEDVSRRSSSDRVRRGLVRTFQITSLFPHLTVVENVLLAVHQRRGTSGGMWRPVAFHAADGDQARRLAAELGLQDDLDRPVRALSYGRQRLVEIAVAMALEPRVLLLDEPAAGIPSAEAHLLLDAVQRLPKEVAILMIEHDMAIVRDFAETVTVLVQGRVLLTDTTRRTMESDLVRAVYLGKAASAQPVHA